MDFFEKLNSLPQDILGYFGSNDLRISLETVCFLYGIPEEDIKKLSLSIRDIFFKDVTLEELPHLVQVAFNTNIGISFGISYELNRKVFVRFDKYFSTASVLMDTWNQSRIAPLVSEEKAWKRVLEIEPWILEEEKEKTIQEKREREKVEQIALEIALDEYPKIAEQGVTNNPIKLQNFLEPVRPSVKNWITDFHFSMGSGKHSPIDRGNYLFHGENGKVLSAAERQKLGLILKSLDEQTLLTIDPEKEIIIFENEQSSRENTVSINREINQIVDLKSTAESRPIVVLNSMGKVDMQERKPVRTWIPDPMPTGRQEVRNDIRKDSGNDKVDNGNDKNAMDESRNDFMQTVNVKRNIAVNAAPAEQEKPFRENNFRNSEPTARQDKIENFYSPKSATANIPEKNQENSKPPVMLKNISFSPNFVAQPKPEKEKVEKLDHRREWTTPIQSITKQTAAAPKEEVFSIPGSKPPIGSAEYDVNKTFPLTQKSFSADVIPKQEHIEERYSNEDADSNVSINEENRDSMSDEMLLKIYKEKSAQQKNMSPNFAKPSGFHIGPLKMGNETKVDKNVVNLKSNHE